MYFGWFIVAAASVVYMLLIGTTVGAFGLFVLPVSNDLHLSRAGINSSFILLQVGSMVAAPFIGRAVDRYPVRRVLAVAAVAFGLAMVLIASSSSILLSALALLLLMPIAQEGAGAITCSVLIVRWFSANRGKAMLIFNLGGPLSGIVVVPIIAYLVGSYGWRQTMLISGVTVTALILAMACLIRERPAPGEGEPARSDAAQAPLPGRAAGERGAPARVAEVLRMRLFWMLGLAYALPMGVALATAISLYPFAIQSGFSATQATLLISTSGISAIGGALLASLVIDRLDRRLLLIGILLIDAVAISLLPSGVSYEVMLFVMVMLGISSGVYLPTTLTYQADVFGPASYGTVRGLMSPLVSIVGAFMVLFAGQVFDGTGHYDAMFYTFVGVELFTASLLGALLLLKPPAASRDLPEASRPA